MSTGQNSTKLLWLAIVADAIASGINGLLLLAGAGLLTVLLGLPEAEMRFVGGFLVLYAVVIAYVCLFKIQNRPMIWIIIIANTVWAIESVLLLFTGWLNPTVLGISFVLAQAFVVALLAAAQLIGLHRTSCANPFPAS